MYQYLNNGGSFSTNNNNTNCDVSFLMNNPLVKALLSVWYKLETALMSYISPLLPTPPHMHMDARIRTHAGLFLGHLASSAELPAEILVQTEVLPLSRNSNADALEAALTAVKCSTINRKKEKRKYALKIILALSLTCFYSKWITHMKCFSTLQWSHKIGCCIKAKITHSVASIYVWMRPKKIWENMIMINKSYTMPSELWSHFCVQYFFKDWAWAISRQIRGGPDFAA